MNSRIPGLLISLFLLSPIAAAQSSSQPVAEPARPKVAVILGGGGAHGVAHVGVLRELENQNVPIDLVVGTGFGGFIGGLYASGMTVDEIETFLLDTDWVNIFDPDTRREDLSFRRKGDDEDFLIKYRVGIKDGQAQLPTSLAPNGKLAQLLQSVTASAKGIDNFDDLPVAYRTVAMDLVDGDEVILKSGTLDRAMLATLSSPGSLPPVEIDGRPLVTGSLINNLPIDVARSWGADVVIVVDVGVYVRGDDDLSSIFAIVDQVSHLIQQRSSEASIKTLRDSDVLIRPALTTAKVVNVVGPADNIKKGATAVAAMSGRFEALRISDEQYAGLYEERVSQRALSPVISGIELQNESKVDDDVIIAQISQKIGVPLDKEALEEDMRKIYGLGEFSTVEFGLTKEDEAAVLQIRAIESRGGNRFWRFGISLQDDLEGNSSYTASASMTWTSLNRLGGEWRNVMRLGEVQQLSTEFYQPLVKSGRYFVSVGGGFKERNVNSFVAGEIIGQARVEEVVGQVSVGRIFGNSGQLAAGILYGSGKTDSNIGSNIPSGKFDIGGYMASATYDTFDNVYFPKRGTRTTLGWTGQRESVGADFDIDIVTTNAGFAKTWGANTLIGGFTLQSQLEDVAGVQNLLFTGGLFQLSGFQRDELTGRHTAVGRAIFYRNLHTNPFRGFLEASLYIGGSLELGNAWQTTNEVKLDNTLTAGSLFVGADTFIGPVYLAGGLAEGGNSAFYLYLGRPF